MPAAPDEASVVEHEIRVAASPETVFGYFTDPVKMVRWMGAEAMLDPRPGGVCRIGFNSAAVVIGRFVEVVPYGRVVFSWGWEAEVFAVPPASTVVEVSLTPDADGTRVRLTHRQLPAEALDFHIRGWAHYFERLAVIAAGRDPGQDPMERQRPAQPRTAQWG